MERARIRSGEAKRLRWQRSAAFAIVSLLFLLAAFEVVPLEGSGSPSTFVIVARPGTRKGTLQASMDLFKGLAESGVQVKVLRYFSALGVGGVFEASDDVASRVNELIRPELFLPSENVTLGTDSLLTSAAISGYDYFPGGNVTGAGVKVAIIDTGVDYTVPALGGSMGVKVVGGYNFVDDNTDIMDTDGHGTAVAGIIAGNSSTFEGVAPGAQLLVYKVVSNGETTSDLIIEALDRAAQDGARVVNLSLGGSLTSNALDSLSQLLYSQGIELVAAIGNDGPDPASTEAPGDFTYYMSVGASVSLATTTPQAEVEIGGTVLTTPMAMNDTPLSVGVLTGFTTFIGNGKPSQVAGLNLTGRIAVSIRDHQTYFSTMEQDAANAGAIALIVVNDSPLSFTANGTDGGPALASNDTSYKPRIPVVAVSGAEGTSVAQSAGDGTNISLAVFNPTTELYPTSFSSVGPADDFTIKPEVLAPGDNVVAPLLGTSAYVEGSGSSFSAPQVAGTLALLAQLHPSLTPEQAFSMISLGATVGQGYFGPFSEEEQGAGFLNVSRTLALPFFLDLHYVMLYPSVGHNYSQSIEVTAFQSGASLAMSYSGSYPLSFSATSSVNGTSSVTVTAAAASSLGQTEDFVTFDWGGSSYTLPVRLIVGFIWVGYDAATGQIFSSYQGSDDASITIVRPDGSLLRGTISSTHNFTLVPDLAGFYDVTVSVPVNSGFQLGLLIVVSASGFGSGGASVLDEFPSFIPLWVAIFSGMVVSVAVAIFYFESRFVRTAGPPWAHGP